MRNEYSLHLESDIEYDYITVYNQIGYIFHKGKEYRYFGKNKKKLTEKFTNYMIERSNYLIYRREDGIMFLIPLMTRNIKLHVY